jgi:hypothetical protein
MALPWEENYQTESAPAPAPAPKKVVVKPVAMPQPAAAVAPDPLVAAMQTRNATAAAAPVAAAPAAPAMPAAPAIPPMPPAPKQQPGEPNASFRARMLDWNKSVEQMKLNRVTEAEKAVREAEKAARELAAPVKKRDLGSTDIDRITKIDDSLGVQNRLLETFKPKYAGYKVKFAGDIANTIGSTFGGENEVQADWWKSYDANDTIARNALFGASLTEGEEKAWKATTVDISMTPSMIERRMKERAALIEAKRKTTVENLGKANFNVDNFQAAPSNFSPAPVAEPPVAALKEGHVTTFKNGQQWILKNGKPEKVN